MIEDRNLKQGVVLKATYRKKEYTCRVAKGEGGKLSYKIGDKTYTSPSAAGSAVMSGVACNGWRFWTVEGSEKSKRAKPATRAATKPAPKTKMPSKPTKRTSKAKPVKGASRTKPPAEKPVSCGECRQEFRTSRAAGEHMRDAHNSAEAAGSGGG